MNCACNYDSDVMTSMAQLLPYMVGCDAIDEIFRLSQLHIGMSHCTLLIFTLSFMGHYFYEFCKQVSIIKYCCRGSLLRRVNKWKSAKL